MTDIKRFLMNFGSKEEMFGAYIEGNLTLEEELIFEEILDDDPVFLEGFNELCEMISNEMQPTGITLDDSDIEHINNYRNSFDIDALLNKTMTNRNVDLELFEVTCGMGDSADLSNSVGAIAGESYEVISRISGIECTVGETAGSVGETAGSVGSTIYHESNLNHDMADGLMQVGENPVNGYSSFVKQGYKDTCAINAQKIILDAYGKSFTEEQLIKQAIDNGLYVEGKGTMLDDMGGLLELNGCPCTNYVFGNVADLTRALAEGKMVMMAVDSGELWNKSLIGKVWEKIEDYIPFVNGADHALLVTGIDARDPDNVLVVVTDPGSGDYNKTYPIEQFVDAAKDSLFFMTVTDNPKPHVFDSFARGNINNLPQIGALNYEDFIKDYNIYFSSGELIPSNVLDQYCLRILGKTYGYEANPVPANENFYPNIWQGDGNTCAIDAQMIVLRDYGIFIPRSELVDYAVNHGWFNPDPERGGTQKQHVGNILDACDITTKRTEDANIYDIIAEIRAGHRVIVSVDADELWIKNEPNLFKKLFGNITNKVNDGVQKALGIEGANHALIVAGVNVNPNNPSDVKVTLIDSGSGEVCIEYNYKDFYNAWKDGKCLMVSTQVPAPYQYNYQTDMIEPSGIETPYIPSLITLPNEFNNEFKLDDSFYVHYSPEPIYTPNNPIWANVNTDYPCLDSSQQVIYAPSTNINHLTQNIGKHGDVANDITENHEAYDIHSDSTIDLIAHSGEAHMVDKPQSNEYAMIHIHGSDVHKHAIPETYVPPTNISDGFTTPTFEHHAGEYGIGTYTEVTGAHTYGYEAPESGETSVGNELDM